ncbi:MAG: phosphatase PAP2 family protein [Alcanivoracaceae bacterium]|nr:phosphatase PAP2 family protein [Alcanivoracaceae bacterium]
MLNNSRVHLLLSVIVLFFSMLAFELTDIDMTVQHWLYNSSAQQWIWDRQEPISRFILYDGIKIALGIFALGLLITLIYAKRYEKLQPYRRALLIAFLTMAITPSIVGTLKAHTNVACPGSLQAFGGTLPYVKATEGWPKEEKPKALQRCFPAGHASGGFGLLGIVLLARTRSKKIVAATGVITLGWAMGLYKMAIGDHFFSHTFISMNIGWLVVSVLACITNRSKTDPQLSRFNSAS